MKKQHIILAISALAGIALAVYAYNKLKGGNEKSAASDVSVMQGKGLGVVDGSTSTGITTGPTGTTYVPGQPIVGQKKPGAK